MTNELPVPKPPNSAWRGRNAPLLADFSAAYFSVWKHGRSLPSHEQELVVVCSRTENELHIHCSHQPWITKLKQNPLFRVNRVLLSENDLILQLEGKLPVAALTLRKKIVEYADTSEEATDDQ